MEWLKENLDRIRKPESKPMGMALILSAAALTAGVVLGLVSKWLDNLVYEEAVSWHRILERLDLGNFLSDLPFWLLAALLIAVFSYTAGWAALNVFLFFAGMCVSYHLYTIIFSGFNPQSYMMIWYAITLVSPVLAVFCWYARGEGMIALIQDTGIMAVFAVSCFAMGYFYVSMRGPLYLLMYIGAAAVLHRPLRQMLPVLAGGFVLALIASPYWPYL